MKTKAKPSRKKGKGTGKCVPPFPIEFRLKVAKLREEEGYPVRLLAEQCGISQDSVLRWAKRYRLYGRQGLVNQARGRSAAKTPAAVTQSIPPAALPDSDW
jgi:transposase